MKNIIFVVIILILIAAIGLVFWFWREQQVLSEKNNIAPPSSSEIYEPIPSASFSPQGTLPSVGDLYQKPAENQVIKFPIFNYHHIRPMPPESAGVTERAFTVTPEGLEAHLKYLKENGYQVVLLDALLDYFDTGQPLSPKAVALTFDDGWREHYSNAFPILKKYGVRATFFVSTGWVGQPEIMSWDEMRQMSEAGMVFGSHSISHPYLDKLSDENLKKEVEDSKKLLEEKLEKKVDYIAYPAGMYNNKVIEAVKAAGYQAALGVYKIIEQSPKFRWTIRRFHADDALESITGKLADY
jgi:peptidoglycan/xylan/chitin deacetylase (PgdA/CDA1 family)